MKQYTYLYESCLLNSSVLSHFLKASFLPYLDELVLIVSLLATWLRLESLNVGSVTLLVLYVKFSEVQHALCQGILVYHVHSFLDESKLVYFYI